MSLSSAEKEQLVTYIKIPAALPLPGWSVWKNSVLSVSVCQTGSGVWPASQISPGADENPSKPGSLHSERMGIWNLIDLSSSTSGNLDCLVCTGFPQFLLLLWLLSTRGYWENIFTPLILKFFFKKFRTYFTNSENTLHFDHLISSPIFS